MECSKCEIAEYCGGCVYQGVPYADQAADKDSKVRGFLQEHHVDESAYEGLVPALAEQGYRNKMEYTFGDFEKGGPLELGMHRKKHFMSIVTSDMCQLVPEDFNRVLRATLDFCRDRGYTFHNKKSHLGLLRNLVVRHGVKTGELLIDIVTAPEGEIAVRDRFIEKINGSSEDSGTPSPVKRSKTCDNGTFDEEGYLECLRALDLDNEIVGVLHTTNSSLADAVVDCGTKILYGRDYYNEEILGLKFRVSIFSFFQTNIRAVERLYSQALDLIPDIEGKVVYDLYCGTGTISQLMSSRAKEVYGIEIVQDAVDSAIANTKLNGITNCHYICGDVREKLDSLEKRPDVIVVDPPRMGMSDKVVRMLAAYGVPEILYISCNPKTMAINLEQFKWLGYEPKVIRSYDNFVLTKHCESVTLLHKVEK